MHLVTQGILFPVTPQTRHSQSYTEAFTKPVTHNHIPRHSPTCVHTQPYMPQHMVTLSLAYHIFNIHFSGATKCKPYLTHTSNHPFTHSESHISTYSTLPFFGPEITRIFLTAKHLTIHSPMHTFLLGHVTTQGPSSDPCLE